MKICSTCKIEKPLKLFHKCVTNTDGYQYQCIFCRKKTLNRYYQSNKKKVNQRTRDWEIKNPVCQRKYQLKRRYGLSLQDYDLMLKSQNSKCLICKSNEKLFIDHCHITGKIRGLLCDHCNRGLGSFKDNVINLQEAINYLKKD